MLKRFNVLLFVQFVYATQHLQHTPCMSKHHHVGAQPASLPSPLQEGSLFLRLLEALGPAPPTPPNSLSAHSRQGSQY